MQSLYRVVVFVFLNVLWLSMSDAQYPQTKYSLDPFLGSYDMIWSQQVNMINLTTGLEGVPLSVTLGGERQTFNKTADGKYQQTVGRNDPRFVSVIVFDLDVSGSLQILGTTPQQTLNYTFTMVNATTLMGTYVWDFVDRLLVFTVQFAFYIDASGFFDTVTVIKPESSAFVATAPFYRLKNGDTGPVTTGPPAA